MISLFISLYSFNTLFINTNSSCLIFESIKALEIHTSMIFNLGFANSTVLSRFFFFFLVIDLQFLIYAVIAQIFNPFVELVIPIGKPSKETNAESKIYPVIVEAKIRKSSI